MSQQSPRCEEVLSEARGNADDRPEIRRHLQACAACTQALADCTRLAVSLRSSLVRETSASASVRSILGVLAAEQRRSVLEWPRLLVASGVAAASFALVFGLTWATRPPARESRSTPVAALSPAPSAALGSGLVVDVSEPHAERVRFEVRGEQGVEQGELDLHTHFVLDTVPANAVVVDTF